MRNGYGVALGGTFTMLFCASVAFRHFSLYTELNWKTWREGTAGGRTHIKTCWSSPRRPCLRMTAISIQENVSLRNLTTLRIGGVARYFVSVAAVPELREAVFFAREKRLPCIVLGGGSNMLLSDGAIGAVVIQNNLAGRLWQDEGDGATVIAAAGENWDGLCLEAAERGLWGIENLSGIPGTVGAAPVQNIGAYGRELKDILEWAEVLDAKTGETRKLSNAECRFGYRDSVFKKPAGKDCIVTRVALRLQKRGVPFLEYEDLKKYFAGKNSPSLSEVRQAVLEIRSRKFPDLKACGTAGSFFKNPIISEERFAALKKNYPELPGFPIEGGASASVKVSLAWILDNICGLKGYRKGNVALFERQPLVLVQNGAASAGEVEAFAEEIAERVKAATGITLEWEVQYVGEYVEGRE